MKNRLLGITLAFILLFSLSVPAFAASDDAQMLSVLSITGVMSGDENGNLNLTNSVTRAEFSKMAVAVSAYRDLGKSTSGISPFFDVPGSHWASGYITVARDKGWITGYLDGSFKPGSTVTLAEAVSVCLRVLGYSDSLFTGVWPTGQMSLYRSLGMDSGITASQNDKLCRLDCGRLIYNMFSANTSSGVAYAVSLGYALDASGNIDYLSLLNKELKGPVVVGDGDWTSVIGFTPKTVYRNDEISDISSISAYDVLYYIKDAGAVWAYSSRRSGTLDSVYPSKTAPTSITVSGVSYTLSTSSAALAVSSVGDYSVGDYVTLLLGRDDSVVAVIDPGAANAVLCGVVTSSGTAVYETGDGYSYTVKYADITTTDGVSRRVKTSSSFSDGSVVSVSYSGSAVSVKKVSDSAVSGKISSDGTTLGSLSLSSDAEILDVYKTSAKTISAKRLAGKTLSSSDILYCVKDTNGDITALILNDVTGDIHSYGILTGAVDSSAESDYYVPLSVKYTYLLNGTQTSFTTNGKAFSVETGEAVQVKSASGTVEGMTPLSSVTLSSVSGTASCTGGGKTYTIAPGASVYEKRSGDYYPVSLEIVSDASKYLLTGWYDSNVGGGYVRVITAVAKSVY